MDALWQLPKIRDIVSNILSKEIDTFLTGLVIGEYPRVVRVMSVSPSIHPSVRVNLSFAVLRHLKSFYIFTFCL